MMEKEIIENVWDKKETEERPITLSHISVFFALVILGIIIGTYGSISVPVGVKQYLYVSGFWPGQVVQGVGCIWFGMWGAIASILFPFISNMLSESGTCIISLAYVPSNLIQGLLVGWAFRHYKTDPCLRDAKSWVTWIVFGCFLATILGAAWGTSMLVYLGNIPQESQLTAFIGWSIGNSFPTFIIGSIVMWFASPVIIKSKIFCKGYWS